MDYEKALEKALLDARHSPRSTWGQLKKLIGEKGGTVSTDELLSILYPKQSGLASRSPFLNSLVNRLSQSRTYGIDENLFL